MNFNFHTHIIYSIAPFLPTKDLYSFASVNKHHFNALRRFKRDRKRSYLIESAASMILMPQFTSAPEEDCFWHTEDIVIRNLLYFNISGRRSGNRVFVTIKVNPWPNAPYESFALGHSIHNGTLQTEIEKHMICLTNKARQMNVFPDKPVDEDCKTSWVLNRLFRPLVPITLQDFSDDLKITLCPSGDCVIELGPKVTMHKFSLCYFGRPQGWAAFGWKHNPQSDNNLYLYSEGEDPQVGSQVREWVQRHNINRTWDEENGFFHYLFFE